MKEVLPLLPNPCPFQVIGVSCHPKLSMIASCALTLDPTIRIWVGDS